MNRDPLLQTVPPEQGQVSCELEAAETGDSSQETTVFDYHPIAPVQTLRVKARIRSIVAGKPMRYDFLINI